MANARNARSVWGEASTQYRDAIAIALEYFRSLHMDVVGLEEALGRMSVTDDGTREAAERG